MTPDTQDNGFSEIGYLTVRVSTAGGAIPLENAAVNIRGGDVDDSDVIYALTTNSDGITPTVSLATPPRSASEAPQNTSPAYAVYNVDVFLDGYAPAFFHNVPVFSGINSVQPAILRPIIENGTQHSAQHVTETPIYELGGEQDNE
ncbi:MAG: hypothetical protein IJY04_11090 [Clostridia bacterium]|nr:hypothetical protein [Clostridia bacterium]